MDCITCREALSARIDGEAENADPSVVDQHLRTCVSCQIWHERAISLTRSLRLGPALPTPDFTAAVLRAHAAAPRPAFVAIRSRLRPRRHQSAQRASSRAALAEPFSTARLILVVIGWLQIGLGLLQIVDSNGLTGHAATAHGTSASHLFNESVAWNLAAGVGMLWAALQPRRAGGLLVALLGAVLILAGFSAYDLLASSVRPARVATHAVLLVGLGLVYLVDRAHQATAPTPGHPAQRRPGAEAHDIPAAQPDVVPRRTHGDDRPLRPAGRQRRAA
ncbi:MAG: zf-HC2 domain-containing protein [Frankia sp.]|nr:zf-HC2 domain-containing protein [Frankia sp.]